ncbi:hypothetical protein O3Q51_12920 [Cryomorphaceae bacterium 1068]|nr:hypothetical protein [Cryomorphaceae bacterium 1068]
MKKQFLLMLLILALKVPLSAQDTFEWSEDYELTLADFLSPESEVNPELTSYSVYPGASIQFSYQMSNAEFAFKKNFNQYATCVFDRKAAAIIAPNDDLVNQLIRVAQFNFDLNELYARKFRKELFDRKKFGSSGDFFQVIWQDLQREMSDVYASVMKQSDMGRKADVLLDKHQLVKEEIDALADFCKTCVPPKKKK